MKDIIKLVFENNGFTQELKNSNFLRNYKHFSLKTIISSLRIYFKFLEINVNSMTGDGKDGHDNSIGIIRHLQYDEQGVIIYDVEKEKKPFRFGTVHFNKENKSRILKWMLDFMGFKCREYIGHREWEIKHILGNKNLKELASTLDWKKPFIVVKAEGLYWRAFECKKEYFDEFVSELKRLELDFKLIG